MDRIILFVQILHILGDRGLDVGQSDLHEVFESLLPGVDDGLGDTPEVLDVEDFDFKVFRVAHVEDDEFRRYVVYREFTLAKRMEKVRGMRTLQSEIKRVTDGEKERTRSSCRALISVAVICRSISESDINILTKKAPRIFFFLSAILSLLTSYQPEVSHSRES